MGWQPGPWSWSRILGTQRKTSHSHLKEKETQINKAAEPPGSWKDLALYQPRVRGKWELNGSRSATRWCCVSRGEGCRDQAKEQESLTDQDPIKPGV